MVHGGKPGSVGPRKFGPGIVYKTKWSEQRKKKKANQVSTNRIIWLLIYTWGLQMPNLTIWFRLSFRKNIKYPITISCCIHRSDLSNPLNKKLLRQIIHYRKRLKNQPPFVYYVSNFNYLCSNRISIALAFCNKIRLFCTFVQNVL